MAEINRDYDANIEEKQILRFFEREINIGLSEYQQFDIGNIEDKEYIGERIHANVANKEQILKKGRTIIKSSFEVVDKELQSLKKFTGNTLLIKNIKMAIKSYGDINIKLKRLMNDFTIEENSKAQTLKSIEKIIKCYEQIKEQLQDLEVKFNVKEAVENTGLEYKGLQSEEYTIENPTITLGKLSEVDGTDFDFYDYLDSVITKQVPKPHQPSINLQNISSKLKNRQQNISRDLNDSETALQL